MIYGFIYNHPEYPVAKWVQFYQVSRSGYYDYIQRRDDHDCKTSIYKNKIKTIFIDSHGTYSPDRICGVLRKTGAKASYRKVSGYMHEMDNSQYIRHKKTKKNTSFKNKV